MKGFSAILSLFCVLLLGGCMSGPTMAELVKDEKIPPLKGKRGRVYFYRPSPDAVTICPVVRVNGRNLPQSRAGGFVVRDYLPSDLSVQVGQEKDRQLYFTIGEGQVRYVRLNPVVGSGAGYVYPELVDNETGEREIATCRSIE